MTKTNIESVREYIEETVSNIGEAMDETSELCSKLSEAERCGEEARDAANKAERLIDDIESELDEKNERVEALEDEIIELRKKIETGAPGVAPALLLYTGEAYVCHSAVFAKERKCPECEGMGVLLSLILANHDAMRDAIKILAGYAS